MAEREPKTRKASFSQQVKQVLLAPLLAIAIALIIQGVGFEIRSPLWLVLPIVVALTAFANEDIDHGFISNSLYSAFFLLVFIGSSNLIHDKKENPLWSNTLDYVEKLGVNLSGYRTPPLDFNEQIINLSEDIFFQEPDITKKWKDHEKLTLLNETSGHIEKIEWSALAPGKGFRELEVTIKNHSNQSIIAFEMDIFGNKQWQGKSLHPPIHPLEQGTLKILVPLDHNNLPIATQAWKLENRWSLTRSDVRNIQFKIFDRHEYFEQEAQQWLFSD
ncbi:MAG: hypothetical protein OIF51_16290 [Cellvibrionaceae bacterium]|nr:hypothetical protein [Cellvibrionaceae bacterium]